MSYAYSEESLVEQPAIQLFGEMGWQTASASQEVSGAGGTLGRETKGEAVLLPRLRATLERLNPSPPSGNHFISRRSTRS
jgi:type I restriction enzyme R subunit